MIRGAETRSVKTHGVSRHWAADYIGKPWKVGCAGPETFDCWGLVVDVYRCLYGKRLSLIPVPENNLKALIQTFNSHPERQHWEATLDPSEGDVALLRQSRYPIHVGLWVDVDGGGILHCIQGAGVVFQGLNALECMGWKVEAYYTYKGDTRDPRKSENSDQNHHPPQPLSVPSKCGDS